MIKKEPDPLMVCKAMLNSIDKQCDILGQYMIDNKIQKRFIRRLQFISIKLYELIEELKGEININD